MVAYKDGDEGTVRGVLGHCCHGNVRRWSGCASFAVNGTGDCSGRQRLWTVSIYKLGVSNKLEVAKGYYLY
jgi:hypothetical protein